MLNFVSSKKERLDKFLAGQISEVSRGKIQKAIKDGLISVNAAKVLEPDYQLKENDTISLPEFGKEELKASTLELKVVFENNDIAVIDKPAGLVVHPGAGNTEDTLAQALLTRYPGIENVGDPHRPGIVHRLDEDTSGLILIAKNQVALDYFKTQFQNRTIEKEYLALVLGVPTKKHDIINEPLEKVPLKQKMRVGSGKEAITEYFVLASDPSGQFTLIRVKLHTGRTHQIRAHLAHIGHPILGDKIYGKKSELLNRPAGHARQLAGVAGRQFLHAYRLKFQLPDKSWVELESELAPELKAVINHLEIRT